MSLMREQSSIYDGVNEEKQMGVNVDRDDESNKRRETWGDGRHEEVVVAKAPRHR